MALTAIVLALAPLQWVAAWNHRRTATRLPMLFHRLACRVMGIRLDVSGTMHAGQTVWVANHLSYLDVLVIGGIAPGSFVAKEDVRGWPVFGPLASLQGTVFISRRSFRAAEAESALAGALASGRNLILFPEGTTSDGSAVLPFKSAPFEVFFSHPAHAHVSVQPLTVSLVSVDGGAVSASNRDLYAYHGDARLGPHLLRFLGTKGARIRLTFHAPLSRTSVSSRKSFAVLAHAAVARGLVASRG